MTEPALPAKDFQFSTTTYTKLNLICKIIAVVLILVTAASGVYNAIGLNGDGSHWLVNILKHEDFYRWDKVRAFGMISTQVPVVLAISFGVTDLNLLIRIHSFGLVAFPVLLWVLALYFQRKTSRFWIFVFAYSFAYLQCAMYAIGVHHVLFAMAALSAAILLREERPNIGECIVLLLMAFAMTRSYAAMVFFGPLLLYIVTGRYLRPGIAQTRLSSVTRILLLMCACLYILGSAVSLVAIVFSQYPQQLGDALDLSRVAGGGILEYSLLMLASYILFLFAEGRYLREIFLAITVALSVFYMSSSEFWPTVWDYHDLRMVSGAGMFVTFILMTWKYFSAEGESPDANLKDELHVPALAFFIALVVPLLFRLNEYGVWLHRFETQLNKRSGFITWEEVVPEFSDLRNYAYGWPNPSLSLVLRQDSSRAIFLAPVETPWQPFDPLKELPVIPPKFDRHSLLF